MLKYSCKLKLNCSELRIGTDIIRSFVSAEQKIEINISDFECIKKRWRVLHFKWKEHNISETFQSEREVSNNFIKRECLSIPISIPIPIHWCILWINISQSLQSIIFIHYAVQKSIGRMWVFENILISRNNIECVYALNVRMNQMFFIVERVFIVLTINSHINTHLFRYDITLRVPLCVGISSYPFVECIWMGL